MNLCIAGWYFRESFINAVADSRLKALIIKHRQGPSLRVESRQFDNFGLEFGCYQIYLDQFWDGASDVLFIHDDSEVDSLEVFNQIERLSESQFNHIYLFNNEYEEFVNMGRHGRAMWCRGSWLAEFKPSGGFPVDWNNDGDTESPALNNGIRDLQKKLAENWPDTTGFAAIVPGLHLGRRGWMSDQVYVYKRTGNGIMTPPS